MSKILKKAQEAFLKNEILEAVKKFEKKGLISIISKARQPHQQAIAGRQILDKQTAQFCNSTLRTDS